MKKVKDYNIQILNQLPKVSISCITFNQENYIGNCIENFLNQNINYPVEILIHDDASTDNTQNIILKYQNKYPNIIKPILQVENQFSRGAKCIHATYNFNRSVGEYIATCEGDDYWIDDYKLHKQVTFLENNTSFSLCSHEIYKTSFKRKKTIKGAAAIFIKNFYLSGFLHFFEILKLFIVDRKEFWNKSRSSKNRKKKTDLEYLLKTYHSGIYIPTLSIVARGDVFRSIPEELMRTPSGHKEHIFWAALNGRIMHFYDVMGQYNRQQNSLTVTKIHLNEGSKLEKYNHLLKFYEDLKTYANEDQIILIEKGIEILKNHHIN